VTTPTIDSSISIKTTIPTVEPKKANNDSRKVGGEIYTSTSKTHCISVTKPESVIDTFR
jgi:hypothetical protein